MDMALAVSTTSLHCLMVWVVYVLLLLLLVLPVGTFLVRGWTVRRSEIADNLSPAAKYRYLQAYHGSYAALDESHAPAEFLKYYEAEFGRNAFVAPFVLCVAFAGSLLYLSADTVSVWIVAQRLEGGMLPSMVVLAILGGYSWVANSVVSTSFRNDVLPRDLYWASFRLAISVPMAFALTSLMNGAAGPTVPAAVAYLMGSFPTTTLMTLARRVSASYLKLTDAPDNYESQLQALPDLDTRTAEQLVDEGISTIQQLAAADPIKLTIRTGLSFSFIVSCVGDALLWVYADKNIDIFRKYGIAGAYDCCNLQVDLNTGETNPEDKDYLDAIDVVKRLATALGTSESGIRTLVWNVAMDPNAQFIYAAWASADDVNDEEDQERERHGGCQHAAGRLAVAELPEPGNGTAEGVAREP